MQGSWIYLHTPCSIAKGLGSWTLTDGHMSLLLPDTVCLPVMSDPSYQYQWTPFLPCNCWWNSLPRCFDRWEPRRVPQSIATRNTFRRWKSQRRTGTPPRPLRRWTSRLFRTCCSVWPFLWSLPARVNYWTCGLCQTLISWTPRFSSLFSWIAVGSRS